MRGVTENIIVGQTSKIGTGCFDMLVDVNKIRKPKYFPDKQLPIMNEIEEANNAFMG